MSYLPYLPYLPYLHWSICKFWHVHHVLTISNCCLPASQLQVHDHQQGAHQQPLANGLEVQRHLFTSIAARPQLQPQWLLGAELLRRKEMDPVIPELNKGHLMGTCLIIFGHTRCVQLESKSNSEGSSLSRRKIHETLELESFKLIQNPSMFKFFMPFQTALSKIAKLAVWLRTSSTWPGCDGSIAPWPPWPQQWPATTTGGWGQSSTCHEQNPKPKFAGYNLQIRNINMYTPNISTKWGHSTHQNGLMISQTTLLSIRSPPAQKSPPCGEMLGHAVAPGTSSMHLVIR